MTLKSLEDLFVDELKDIHDAERRLTKALPKMMKAASSPELSSALEEHLRQTEEHVTRLDRIFERLGESPGRKTCAAMVGLLEEGQELLEEDGPDHVKDAAIIAAAQKVEHYEIATYGCLRDWAELLDNGEAVKILQKTLDEEGEADRRLTQIARSLNVEAMEEGEEEEEGQAVAVARTPNRGRSSGNGGARPRSR